jgi:hypothetical protein
MFIVFVSASHFHLQYNYYFAKAGKRTQDLLLIFPHFTAQLQRLANGNSML